MRTIVADRGPHDGHRLLGQVRGQRASSQVIRGSGLNHDSWRRTSRRVSAVVSSCAGPVVIVPSSPASACA